MSERKTNEELIQEIKNYYSEIQRLTNDMYIRPNKLSTEELMEEFEYPQSKPEEQKSRVGYFAGAPDRTIGTRGDPNNPLIPLVVPTLDREEMDLLAAGKEPTDKILYRARTHANDRIDQGLSPFAGVDEVRELPVKKENSMKLDVFLKKLSKATIPTGALEVELPDAKGEKKEVDIKATRVVKSAMPSDAGVVSMVRNGILKRLPEDAALAPQALERLLRGGKTEETINNVIKVLKNRNRGVAASKVDDLFYIAKDAPSGLNYSEALNSQYDEVPKSPAQMLEMVRNSVGRHGKKSAFDSFLKRAELSQLDMGKEVEKEHTDTYNYIKENGLPSLDEFVGMIASDHLKEMPDYYTKLNAMEKQAGVADFLKRLGTKTKPEQKPEGLLKLIDDIKPKEDPMQKLLELEIQKGGAFNLNQVLKELEAKATKGAMTSTVKNPAKSMYSLSGGVVPTKDTVDYWLKREGRRIVR